MGTSCAFGYKNYKKNGGTETHFVEVMNDGEFDWGGMAFLALLNTSIPGNKDMLKTMVDFVNSGEVLSGGVQKTRGTIRDFYSMDNGVFGNLKDEKTLPLGVEGDDPARLADEFEFVYFVDYTANLGFGEVSFFKDGVASTVPVDADGEIKELDIRCLPKRGCVLNVDEIRSAVNRYEEHFFKLEQVVKNLPLFAEELAKVGSHISIEDTTAFLHEHVDTTAIVNEAVVEDAEELAKTGAFH